MKYWLLAVFSAAPAVAEVVVAPALFEDFAGTATIRLERLPSQRHLPAGWRLEVVVLARDLSEDPVLLHEVGLRLRQDDGSPPPTLCGSVTLSTTRAESLDEAFAANLGESAVTFFAWGRPHAGRGVVGPALLFELARGYRFDPGADGNLVISFELPAERDLALEAVPSLAPRSLLAPDRFAVAGRLGSELPVLLFALERLTPTIERAPADTPVARGDRPGEPEARPARGTEIQLAGQVRTLQLEIARLETRLERLASDNRQLTSTLNRQVGQLARQIAEQELQDGSRRVLRLPGRQPGREGLLAEDEMGGGLAEASAASPRSVPVSDTAAGIAGTFSGLGRRGPLEMPARRMPPGVGITSRPGSRP